MKQISFYLLVSLVFTTGCWVNNAKLLDIDNNDILGEWEASYAETNAVADSTGMETIIFYPDETYQQYYKDGSGYVYHSQRYPWKLDSSNGVIHLYNGRWYPNGVTEAENYTKGASTLSIPIRGERYLVNLGDEILIIAYMKKNELLLGHMQVGDPDGLGTVFFYKVKAGTNQ